MSPIRRAATAALVVLALAQTGPAGAQLRPLPQTVISRGKSDPVRPVPLARSRHNVFGTIVSFASPRLLLRMRSGRLLVVDATIALQTGTYSAPLFPGKLVVIGGSIDAHRVLHALNITRITRFDTSTPGDT